VRCLISISLCVAVDGSKYLPSLASMHATTATLLSHRSSLGRIVGPSRDQDHTAEEEAPDPPW
jgi:hypothetical protein